MGQEQIVMDKRGGQKGCLLSVKNSQCKALLLSSFDEEEAIPDAGWSLS
jgi:hypothetical protein